MLFTNSNPNSCPFSGCYITILYGCIGSYSSIAQGCPVLSVTSSGEFSAPDLGIGKYCCRYEMKCYVNGQLYTSNPF